MKSLLLFFMFLVGTNITCQAQSNIDTTKKFNMVYLPDYYKEKGIFFNKDYVVGIDMNQLQFRYTPTKKDLIKAEELFNKKYNELERNSIDTKKFFCHWVRQYIGLIDSNGNKNIIVQLIDNTKPRKLNRLLGKDWETEFVIYFSDPFPSLGILFRLNIDTGDMSTQL